MSDEQILEAIAAGATKRELLEKFGWKPMFDALIKHGYTWDNSDAITKRPVAAPLPAPAEEPKPAPTPIPRGIIVTRPPAKELTPSQEEYREREKARLRNCLKLRVKLPAEISPYQGWRRDPRVPGYAYHPSHGYVRYMASDNRQKIGQFATLEGWRGKFKYRVWNKGKRVDRYLDGLMYDTGHSSHNPYYALRGTTGSE